MAGHSKWSNIQHRKGKQDKIRSKIFSKLSHAITIATKEGNSGDPEHNFKLRLAIDKANAANMTKDTINKAIKKAINNKENTELQSIIYEAYGQFGVAILIECITDNKNRTVGAIRGILNKYNGKLGTDGSVSYLFEKKAVFVFDKHQNYDRILELALDENADDIISNAEKQTIILASPDNFYNLHKIFSLVNIPTVEEEIKFLAKSQLELNTMQQEKIQKLLITLDDIDDVQNIYCNVLFDK